MLLGHGRSAALSLYFLLSDRRRRRFLSLIILLLHLRRFLRRRFLRFLLLLLLLLLRRRRRRRFIQWLRGPAARQRRRVDRFSMRTPVESSYLVSRAPKKSHRRSGGNASPHE